DRSILQKYIGSLANLKLVILPVSYFSFGYDISETTENWRMNFYKKVYGIDCEGKHDIFDAKGYSYFALYGKEESLRCIFNGFKVNYAKDYKRNGVLMESSFDIKAGLVDISDESGKKRIEFHNSCIKPENYEKNISYMKEMIETLEKRKIKVVLITTPVYKTYSQNMSPKYYEDMQNIIKKITDKYGIKYFNYINDSRFVVEDFRNNDHLNPNGAVKFSKILNNEILSKEL
ncbi:MAG TPA: DUF1574 family protein, partial [Clostridia bacterium]